MTRVHANGFVSPGKKAYGSSVDVGRVNAESVLRALLAEGPLARAAIAERVGLTRATVTRVTARLMGIGLLREGNPIRPTLGRPLVPLELSGENRVVATAHFGALEVRIGLVSLRGETLVERRLSYGDPDPRQVVSLAVGGITRVLASDLGSRQVLGVGASIGGWVNPETGSVMRYPPLGWSDVPLARMLADELEWPLYFDQMVRGIALAERMFGAARNNDDFVELWVGNVLGAAIVSDGVIRHGPRGASGLVSHLPVNGPPAVPCLCGGTSCLASVATDDAVLAQARIAGIVGNDQGMRHLIDMAGGRDERVNHLVDRTARHLGGAAAGIVDLLNPSLFVVAGLITEAPTFLRAFRAALIAKSERPIEGDLTIALSNFGDLAPTIASAALVLDAFFGDPFAFESPER